MMPFHERFDFGFQTAVTVAAFYLLGSLLFVFGLLAYEVITGTTDADTANIMLFLILATVFVLAYGFFIAAGAWISALLFPAVTRSQLYWLGPGITGLLCTVGLYLMTLEITLDPFEIEEFALILFLSGIGIFFSRVLGLTLGWARPWTPPGACESCGYDLRHTPPGGNCPECGAVVEKPFVARS